MELVAAAAPGCGSAGGGIASGVKPRRRAFFARAPEWLVLLALSIGCAAGESPDAPQADPSSRRSLPMGDVVGARTADGAHAWVGLPFAEPPIGALRWRAPRPAKPWRDTREALEFGPACPQFAGPQGGSDGASGGEPTGSEDCLYLNVYAPIREASDVPRGADRWPVMLWIHGGGNTVGDAVPYDGSLLAREFGVVVVTVQYRMGVFGWLDHAALHTGDPLDDSGNFGTLDLVEALRFVQRNISAFGGDPDRVTVFGESAGGSNTFTMILSPMARGLFHRAIVQSGSVGTTPPHMASNLVDQTPGGHAKSSGEIFLEWLIRAGRADDRAAALAVAEAMSTGEQAAFMRGLDVEAVLAPYRGAGFGGMYDLPKVFADGHVLPSTPPMQALAEGRYNQVPTVLGTNRDEVKLFMLFGSDYVSRLGLLPIRLRNPRLYDAHADVMTRLWKARGVDEPALAMRAAQGPSVFAYRFDWDDEPDLLWMDLGRMLGAAHAFEIPFVFGWLSLGAATGFIFDDQRAEQDLALSRTMMSYWTEFARTGDPGRGRSGDAPEWSPWGGKDGASPEMLVFDVPEDGGVRMAEEGVTTRSVIESVAVDPRFANLEERCGVYREMARRGGRQFGEAELRAVEGGACAPGDGDGAGEG